MHDVFRVAVVADVAHNMRRPALLNNALSLGATTALCLGWLVGAPLAFAQDAAQEPGSTTDLESTFERCQAIKDDAARLYCYKDSIGSGASAGRREPAALGTWHLARTPNPAGGRPAVSIMQGADISKSDPDLAGLMLRCGDGTIEVLIVLVRYLRPGAQIDVTVSAGQTRTELAGRVVPPGLLVLLPPGAMSLAAGAWQALPELSINLNDEGSSVQGVVPLAGIGGALRVLQSSCAAQ